MTGELVILHLKKKYALRSKRSQKFRTPHPLVTLKCKTTHIPPNLPIRNKRANMKVSQNTRQRLKE